MHDFKIFDHTKTLEEIREDYDFYINGDCESSDEGTLCEELWEDADESAHW